MASSPDRLRLYRLVKPAYAPGLDGAGAKKYPGRWNPPGLPMVYTATTVSLAVLETFVHLPPELRRARAFPPVTLVTVTLDPARLDDLVEAPPEDLKARRALGAAWTRDARSVGLRVPSAVNPYENNVLLNPAHPDWDAAVDVIQQEPFTYDPRMGG
ncbi:MAG: RES family NAD+ phosphorylase [Shimia sp.]